MRIPKSQVLIVALSLIFLRVAIGYHFFKEGTDKLDGNFSSKYFLNEAKGPNAPFFRSFLDDPDGVIRLCLVTEDPLRPRNEEFLNPIISPDFTFLIWEDYVDKALQYYGDNGGLTDQDSKLARALEILDNHKQMLEEFLDENRAELKKHFGTIERLQGFDRDGEQRELVAQHVESLRYQVDSIRAERRSNFNKWCAEVEEIWDSLELEIHSLASGSPKQKQPLLLHRPFDQPYSWEKTIDRIIPWFDTTVGILLILGLFTRFASLLAGSFLVSVIATQPPWIPGVAPTYLYFVELAGLCVLFSMAAGRFGGLDFFLNRLVRKTLDQTSSEDSVNR